MLDAGMSRSALWGAEPSGLDREWDRRLGRDGRGGAPTAYRRRRAAPTSRDSKSSHRNGELRRSNGHGSARVLGCPPGAARASPVLRPGGRAIVSYPNPAPCTASGRAGSGTPRFEARSARSAGQMPTCPMAPAGFPSTIRGSAHGRGTGARGDGLHELHPTHHADRAPPAANLVVARR